MPKRKEPTEAEIQAQIAADPDDFELTDEQLAQGKSFAETFPDLAAKRGPGRPHVAAPKKLLSLRLDPDVIEKFKSTGAGWQQKINEALRRAKVK
jgi:uncharacterized protein (DUF4415 family)